MILGYKQTAPIQHRVRAGVRRGPGAAPGQWLRAAGALAGAGRSGARRRGGRGGRGARSGLAACRRAPGRQLPHVLGVQRAGAQLVWQVASPSMQRRGRMHVARWPLATPCPGQGASPLLWLVACSRPALGAAAFGRARVQKLARVLGIALHELSRCLIGWWYAPRPACCGVTACSRHRGPTAAPCLFVAADGRQESTNRWVGR